MSQNYNVVKLADFRKESFQLLWLGGGGEDTRKGRPLLPHLLLHLQHHFAFLTLLLLIVEISLDLPTVLEAHLQEYRAMEDTGHDYEDEAEERDEEEEAESALKRTRS